MSCFSSEWPHYHHQDNVTDQSNVLSPSKSSLMSHINDLKPTKIRKSKASKRPPVTVLNADVSNFRALVQELTGRPNAPTSLRAQRGPLNINFRRAKEVNFVDGANYTAPKMLPFMYNKQHQQQQLQQQLYHSQQQAIVEHEQVMMSSSSGQSKGPLPEFWDDPKTNSNYWEKFDDLAVEQCLEELTWVVNSNVDGNGL